jgi:hypothetical protein
MEVLQTVPILRLSEHYGDATPGATVFARVSGLEQLTDSFGNRCGSTRT